MPRTLILAADSDYPTPVPVATEEELLAFANKLRAAGHAEPLDSLMPSNMGNAESCLIANACNFSSIVRPASSASVPEVDYRESAESAEFSHWILSFPRNMGRPRAEAVADAVDLELQVQTDPHTGVEFYSLVLPREIGNAAHAFDAGIAFQEYAA